jgi:hypothetical protein
MYETAKMGGKKVWNEVVNLQKFSDGPAWFWVWRNFFGDSYVQRIVYEYEVSHFDRPRGRCYDHNFLRFLTIFGEKIGVFLKNQCYDQNIA